MDVKNSRGGFNFVETMVVVTIIGILAAMVVPRVFTYSRTGATSEIANQISAIAAAIGTYAKAQSKTAEALKAELDGATVTPDLSGARELFLLIPQALVPKDGNFDYAIAAEVATAGPMSGEVVYCIVAAGRETSLVRGGLVLFSAAATKAAGWDGHINRLPFVDGQTTLAGVQPGGYCSAMGTAQATCTIC